MSDDDPEQADRPKPKLISLDMRRKEKRIDREIAENEEHCGTPPQWLAESFRGLSSVAETKGMKRHATELLAAAEALDFVAYFKAALESAESLDKRLAELKAPAFFDEAKTFVSEAEGNPEQTDNEDDDSCETPMSVINLEQTRPLVKQLFEACTGNVPQRALWNLLTVVMEHIEMQKTVTIGDAVDVLLEWAIATHGTLEILDRIDRFAWIGPAREKKSTDMDD
jgi:hypothetical protein